VQLAQRARLQRIETPAMLFEIAKLLVLTPGGPPDHPARVVFSSWT